MKIQMFIAAGGKGKRLKISGPKSLISIEGKSLIAHIIDTALGANIDEIVVGIDEGKEELIASLPDYVNVQFGCKEPLTQAFFESARTKKPDIILGVNGDTLYHSVSIRRVLDLLEKYPEATGALLLTDVVKPLITSTWIYWRHRLESHALVEMEEVGGHEIKTELVLTAFRTKALRELTRDFTESFMDWKSMPFRCYSLGWDYLLRIILWQNREIVGAVSHDTCLNINIPEDLEGGRLFFKEPELFCRWRRQTSRAAENGKLGVNPRKISSY